MALAKKLEIAPDIISLAEKCRYEQTHTLQVTRLALKLFNELKSLHKLPASTSRYLIAGAILHDIGWSVGAKGHHKSAYNIVTSERPKSLSPEEAEIVGLIARYHRKTPPAEKHTPFTQLPTRDQKLVRQLSALLRIADGLDRGHNSVVLDLSCRVDDETVEILLTTTGPADLEIWGAERKSDLFEEVYGRTLSFRVEILI